MALGEGGRAYLSQRGGAVVARSDAGAGPHVALDAALARVEPAALVDGEPVTVEVEADGERHVAAFEAFEIDGGLRWITAVVTPTRTVRGDVHATAQVLLALGGGLLSAILIGALMVLLRRHRRVRRKETLRLP